MKFRVSKKEFEAKIGIPLVSDIEFEGEPVEEKCKGHLDKDGNKEWFNPCNFCHQPKQVEDSKKGGINGCYCAGQPCAHSKAPTEEDKEARVLLGAFSKLSDKFGYQPKEIEEMPWNKELDGNKPGYMSKINELVRAVNKLNEK